MEQCFEFSGEYCVGVNDDKTRETNWSKESRESSICDCSCIDFALINERSHREASHAVDEGQHLERTILIRHASR